LDRPDLPPDLGHREVVAGADRATVPAPSPPAPDGNTLSALPMPAPRFRRVLRRDVAAALIAVGLVACSAAEAVAPETSAVVPSGTVGGVGVLPTPASTAGDRTTSSDAETTATDPGDSAEDSTDATADTEGDDSSTSTTLPRGTTTTTVAEDDRTVGQRVMGNRVLMIGDSILASTAHRYGDNMCKALVPLGWRVDIEAEVSREITFGNKVLARKMSAGWDAALILLGNNYGGDPDFFLKELVKMIQTLSPRPIVLLTVTEFESKQTEVNDVIRGVGEAFDNVIVVDWASASLTPGSLGEDGLHLTDAGREVLAQTVAPYFGQSPVMPGECLGSTFHDDSAGSVYGPKGKPTTTTVKPTTSTVKPGSTTTTVKPGTSTTSSTPSGSTPTSSSTPTATTTTSPYNDSPPSTVAPSTTAAPATTATTAPAHTQPPQTQPSVTLPPEVTGP
jgi:hypothetical protein